MPRLLEIYREFAEQTARRRVAENPRMNRDDAESAALVGLWKALERFDVTAGTQFTTFATTYCGCAVIDMEREADQAPTKLRTAEKKGEVGPLPVMFPLDSAEASAIDLIAEPDEPEQPPVDPREDLERLLQWTDPEAARILRLAMSVEMQQDELAELLGTTEQEACILLNAALSAARRGGQMNMEAAFWSMLQPQLQADVKRLRSAVGEGITHRRTLYRKLNWRKSRLMDAANNARKSGDVLVITTKAKKRRPKPRKRAPQKSLAGC